MKGLGVRPHKTVCVSIPIQAPVGFAQLARAASKP
jgi:hypothetical protein